MNQAYKTAQESNNLAHNRNVRNYRIQNNKQFEVGDLVLLRNEYRTGVGAKFKSRWVGPYRVK
jgi:hypothetical protein